MNKGKERFVICVCVLAIFISSMFLLDHFVKRYSREGFVAFNNGEQLVLEDSRGNLYGWTIKNLDEFLLSKRDKVILIFDDKGTDDNAKDDVLIKVKKKK